MPGFLYFRIMKYLIPALFLLLISCSNPKTPEAVIVKQDTLVVERDTLQVGKHIYFIQNLTDINYKFTNVNFPGDSDIVQISKVPAGFVTRIKDTLFLKLDNGNTLRLKDNRSAEDDFTAYSFVEFNKDINYYVVFQSLYESGLYLLINKTDGTKHEAFGYPYVSPRKDYFVCGNCDLVAGFRANGLEIYKKKGNEYVLEGTRELANWGPEQMLWLDDSTLVIKGSKLTSDGVTQASVFKSILIK